MGKTETGCITHRRKVENIICLGDSNTWGYDPRGYFGGRYDHPWPGILAAKLGCTVINRGENGQQIPSVSVEFPDDTDILIVMLGTNDLLQGATAEEVCLKMERFLETLEREKVLLLAPPSMRQGAWVNGQNLIEASQSLALHYRTLAQRMGIRFVDAGQWGLAMAYDGVHLTQESHCVFAELLYKELIQA